MYSMWFGLFSISFDIFRLFDFSALLSVFFSYLFGSLFDTYRTPLGSALSDVPGLPLISVEDRPGKRPMLVEFGAKRGDGLCPHRYDCPIVPLCCNSLPRSRMNRASLTIPFHTNSPRPPRSSRISCSRGARSLAASSLCLGAECRRTRSSAGATGRALRLAGIPKSEAVESGLRLFLEDLKRRLKDDMQ